MDGDDDGSGVRRTRSGRRKDGQCLVGRIGARSGWMMGLTGCIAYYMDPSRVAFSIKKMK